MPAGFEVTVPLPLPARPTVSVNCRSAKVAVTAIRAVHGDGTRPGAGAAPPDQPVNTESAAGAADNVTTVWAS